VIKEQTTSLLGADDPAALSDINASLDALSSTFDNLSSEYRRIKFFEESGYLIHAESYVVNERTEHFGENIRVVVQNVASKATFVPLGKVLTAFLELLPGFFVSMMEYMSYLKSCPDDVLENFVQAEW